MNGTLGAGPAAIADICQSADKVNQITQAYAAQAQQCAASASILKEQVSNLENYVHELEALTSGQQAAVSSAPSTAPMRVTPPPAPRAPRRRELQNVS